MITHRVQDANWWVGSLGSSAAYSRNGEPGDEAWKETNVIQLAASFMNIEQQLLHADMIIICIISFVYCACICIVKRLQSAGDVLDIEDLMLAGTRQRSELIHVTIILKYNRVG